MHNVQRLREALNKVRASIYYAYVNDEGEFYLYNVPDEPLPINAKCLIAMAVNETAGLPWFHDIAGKEARDGGDAE